jgi:hypothetical protein
MARINDRLLRIPATREERHGSIAHLPAFYSLSNLNDLASAFKS